MCCSTERETKETWGNFSDFSADFHVFSSNPVRERKDLKQLPESVREGSPVSSYSRATRHSTGCWGELVKNRLS